MKYMPTHVLEKKHGYVKGVYVSEAHTSFLLRLLHLLPTQPMHLPFLVLLALPKITYHRTNMIT